MIKFIIKGADIMALIYNVYANFFRVNIILISFH